MVGFGAGVAGGLGGGAGSSSSSGGGGGGAPSFSRQAAKAFSGTGTDAPTGPSSPGGLGGSQGHAQPKVTIKMDSYNPKTKKTVLSPEATAEAEADVPAYFSKTDIFGDTRSDQVQYAKQNNLRDVTFHGEFGSTFGHVTGLAPHPRSDTSW